MGISCVRRVIFPRPIYATMIDAERFLSLLPQPSAYIPHDRRAAPRARAPYPLPFLPSFLPSTTIQPEAIAGAIPTSY